MPIYDAPTWMLMKRMVDDLPITKGDVVTRQKITHWFQENYPLINTSTVRAHLRRMSTNVESRVNHNASSADDLFYQIDRERFRLYEPDRDPAPIYERDTEGFSVQEEVQFDNPQSEQEFAYEKDLQQFLIKNLPLIEPGLRLYEEDDIKGIEFDVGGRFVDILAVDSSENLVVIELKVSKAYDKVVGQLLRYIGWIKNNMATDGQRVRGMIIGRVISYDLKIACSELKDVQLFEYSLAITLKEQSL